MQIIKMHTKGPRLTRFTSGTVVEGSYGYLKFEFIFKTEDWNTVTTKTAVFSYKGKNYEAELDENNQCYVPKEAIHDPCFKVSLYGGEIHTNTVTIPVEPREDNDDATGVVFVPEIDDKKILSWTIKEIGDDLTVPAPTDLNIHDDWVDDETVSEYVWEEE